MSFWLCLACVKAFWSAAGERGWLIGVQFGAVTNEESCLGWKPYNLEGCRGLNNFFIRLGVTTELCRGDTNVSGVHRGDTNVPGGHPDAP